MPAIDYDAVIRNLAVELKRRDERDKVQFLRKYFADYRARQRAASLGTDTVWTEERVVDLLCILQVPPFDKVLPVLPWGAPCPRCAHDVERDTVTVEISLRDRCVRRCAKCEARWLQLDGAGSNN